MDLNGKDDDLDISLSSVASTSRNQVADSDPGNDHRRAKARERQRRKRERDRAGMGVMTFTEQNPTPAHTRDGQSAMSPEEIAKKERIKIAARERQRKHRAVVKAKRMEEMGLQMAMENASGVPYHEGYAHLHHAMHDGDPNNHLSHPEPPFPMPQPHHSPGQTFASILLLSFSCTPLLKQHLLRTLHMTNEDLASFEPIIAGAWDHWDRERSLQYAANHPDGAAGPSSPYQHPGSGPPPGHSPFPPDPQQLHADAVSEFRNRFQRQHGAYVQTSTRHPIDPSLNPAAENLSVSDVRGDEEDDQGGADPDIDPELGHGNGGP